MTDTLYLATFNCPMELDMVNRKDGLQGSTVSLPIGGNLSLTEVHMRPDGKADLFCNSVAVLGVDTKTFSLTNKETKMRKT